MQKLKIILAAFGLIAITSCGNNENKTDAATPMDTIGAAPAPSTDATDMSRTSMDSLNTTTTDVRVDTPLKTNKPATGNK